MEYFTGAERNDSLAFFSNIKKLNNFLNWETFFKKGNLSSSAKEDKGTDTKFGV